MLARIVGVAQVTEIFADQDGPDAAMAVVRERRGRWFDPDLVRAFGNVASDAALWARVASEDVDREVAAVEPQVMQFAVDEQRLDRIASAFAWVVDAKSPFTYHHSERVAEFDRVCGILSEDLGFDLCPDCVSAAKAVAGV